MVSPKFLLKKIDILLEATKNGASRTRYVFLTTIISSAIILISVFNSYWSWARHWNMDDREGFAIEHHFITSSFFDSVLLSQKKQLLKYPIFQQKYDSLMKKDEDIMKKIYADIFFQRRSITLPLLNVKCYVDDISAISGAAFVVIITWFFFTVRRENHSIRKIQSTFNSVHKSGPHTQNKYDLLDFIFQGCSQSFIFLTATKFDKAEASSKNKKSIVFKTNINIYIKKSEVNSFEFKKNSKATIEKFKKIIEDNNYKGKTSRTGRVIVALLHFIVPFTLFVTMFSDIFSLFNPIPLYNSLSTNEKIEVWLRDGLCFVCFIYCLYYCYHIIKLNNESIDVLSAMNSSLEELESTPGIGIYSDNLNEADN